MTIALYAIKKEVSYKINCMSSFKSFKTQRLFIQPTREEDADLIYKLMNTPKFIEHVGSRNINSIDEATQYIQLKMLPQLQKLGYSNYTLLTIENGEKIGICGLYNREGIAGVDIGFGLLPEYEGCGYAYEASKRILKAGFEEFEISTIKAITSKKNTASQTLLNKLGLEMIGTTTLPNENEELLLYELENKNKLQQEV